jgi:hypothetical protein
LSESVRRRRSRLRPDTHVVNQYDKLSRQIKTES